MGSDRLDVFLEKIGQTWVMDLRRFLETLDWSSFRDVYSPVGRRPYDPMAMVGLVLLGVMEGATSLRVLEERSRRDVAWWWVTGGISPDHSIIGRFLQLHEARLTGEFFEELTRGVIEATGARTSTLAGDGTVVQAAASRYGTLKAEAARAAADEARKKADDDPDDSGAGQRADQAEEVARAAEERTAARRAKGRKNTHAQVCPSEPEAVVQPLKSGAFAPAYKPSILASEDRIIAGYAVHPTSETAALGPMLEQTLGITGSYPDRLLLDAGYHGSQSIKLALDLDLDLLCPHGRSIGDGEWEKKSSKQIPRTQFAYDERGDVYLCPQGRKLVPGARVRPNDDRAGYFRYRCEDCSGCPLLSSCTLNGTERSIRRYDDEPEREALRAVMRHPEARRRYRKRQAWVEPVFSELRGVQKLARFLRRGLAGARLEFSLHAMAHNLRRLLAVTRQARDTRSLVARWWALWGAFLRRPGALEAP